MNILDIFRRAQTMPANRTVGLKKRLKREESKTMRQIDAKHKKHYKHASQMVEAHPKSMGHVFKPLPSFIIAGQNRLQSIEYTRRMTARFLKESRVFPKHIV